jgi:DNA-binding beta-propeller fold protein YncE
VTVAFVLLLAAAAASAQRPSDPALLVPQEAPPLDYVPAPRAVSLPPGMTMGAPASVAFDARGHLLVLTRGTEAFFEFDESGAYVRSFGGSVFTRAHGLRIDEAGNLWATDVGAHTVMKFDRDGRLRQTLGTRAEAGDWNEATGSHKLNQPTDVAINARGDVFVSQGHTPGAGGDARVLKFDKDGHFLTSWGGKGAGPGRFQVAHGLALDAQGQVWVMDRENQLIQVFSPDGAFVRQMRYAGLPCSVTVGRQYAYMVNGYAAQVLRLDLAGNVLAAMGKSGMGPGEFGEAHFIAVSPKDEIVVADSVNGALVKFIRRP